MCKNQHLFSTIFASCVFAMAKIKKTIQWTIARYNEFKEQMFRLKPVRIEKQKFMRSRQPLAVANTATVDKNLISKSCRMVILSSALMTAFITFLTTIPSAIWASVFLIIIDVVQFQLLAFAAEQKILYVYGCEDFWNNNQSTGRNIKFLMWFLGKYGLPAKTSIAESAAGFAIRKLISMLMMRSGARILIVNAIRQGIKWTGIIVAHEVLLDSFDMIVCVVCASIAGAVSFIQFGQMIRNLEKELSKSGVDKVFREFDEENDGAKVED